ncbi:fumarylacetoacetate hydrolase family protein [Paraburkholderia sp. MPAMCS5]|uniref:fumarylacetoacetate hydrolase family protein n=1 Tax=Paraburkholderia sp. MPAMCS5 TaxID=3112563 RepID=UPI002E173665|nr:fumarylacetoacetate hydrolase family protein [Paraburkholderia sp. MPAMCS5]
MESMQIGTVAHALFAALDDCEPVAPLTTTEPGMTIADAYEIQRRMIAARLAKRGERIVGKKIGITSEAVMNMLDVRQPDFGQLTSGMQHANGATIPLSQFIAPRAEGEIAFLLAKDLSGPGLTAQDVLDATEWVMPCFEIVDSRIRDWKIRIQDTVADNASSGAFVIGEGRADPRTLDLAAVTMRFSRNGKTIGTGQGSAALGHPLNAVVWLANQLGEFGMPLRAGEVILSGALSAMVPARAGDHMRVEFDGLGHADVAFA